MDRIDTKTIEIVIPDYIDTLIVTEETVSQEKIIQFLSKVGKYTETRLQRTANDYIQFLSRRMKVYDQMISLSTYIRNDHGNELARLRPVERKYKMLDLLMEDSVFSRFLRFTSEERSETEITAKPPLGFNPASGRSLIKWGVWLGATLYLPHSEKYRSFTTRLSPSHSEFWSAFVDAYRFLQKQSYLETLRFNVSIPEVRSVVCVSMGMMPLTFDQLLTELVESGERIQKLELVGMPQHRLPNVQRKHLEPLIVQNKAYYYVIVH